RSPTCFIHLVIVPSAIDSPICGITTSVAIVPPTGRCGGPILVSARSPSRERGLGHCLDPELARAVLHDAPERRVGVVLEDAQPALGRGARQPALLVLERLHR